MSNVRCRWVFGFISAAAWAAAPALCLLMQPLPAGLAARQEALWVPPRNATGTPFAFVRRIVPSPGFSDDQLLAWIKAADDHRPGEADVVSSPLFLERAASLFPDDAELLLMAGGARELIASPRAQTSAGVVGADVRELHGREPENLRRTEEFFRRAIETDASLVEAHVRLGRVLALRQRHEEALAELGPGSEAAGSPELRYFAFLFLGDEEDAVDRPDRARATRPEATSGLSSPCVKEES